MLYELVQLIATWTTLEKRGVITGMRNLDVEIASVSHDRTAKKLIVQSGVAEEGFAGISHVLSCTGCRTNTNTGPPLFGVRSPGTC
jgi:hypothetical protein